MLYEYGCFGAYGICVSVFFSLIWYSLARRPAMRKFLEGQPSMQAFNLLQEFCEIYFPPQKFGGEYPDSL